MAVYSKLTEELEALQEALSAAIRQGNLTQVSELRRQRTRIEDQIEVLLLERSMEEQNQSLCRTSLLPTPASTPSSMFQSPASNSCSNVQIPTDNPSARNRHRPYGSSDLSQSLDDATSSVTDFNYVNNQYPNYNNGADTAARPYNASRGGTVSDHPRGHTLYPNAMSMSVSVPDHEVPEAHGGQGDRYRVTHHHVGGASISGWQLDSTDAIESFEFQPTVSSHTSAYTGGGYNSTGQSGGNTYGNPLQANVPARTTSGDLYDCGIDTGMTSSNPLCDCGLPSLLLVSRQETSRDRPFYRCSGQRDTGTVCRRTQAQLSLPLPPSRSQEKIIFLSS